jgi:hypothetical protein
VNTLFTKDRILLTLRAVTSIGIILFLLFYVDINSIYETILAAKIHLVLIVLVLSFLNLFLQYKKWHLVARHELNISNKFNILQSLFYGIGAGIFTPMKVGEYVARAIPFKDNKITDVSIATFIDKVFNMMLIILIGAVCSLYFIYDTYVRKSKLSFESYTDIIVTITITILSITLIGLLVVKRKKRIAKFFGLSERTSITLKKLSIIRVIKGKYFVKLLFFAISLHIVFTTQFLLLIWAYAPELNLFIYVLIPNLVFFTQIIIPPIFLGELGIREGATVFFLESYGFEPSVGFSAALTLFVINFILPAVYSLFITSKSAK